MTDLIQRLTDQGFSLPYLGAAYYQKSVPGRFGFTVQVAVEDYDGEPLDLPTYEVHLPHQCDAWGIVATDDPRDALGILQVFAHELAQAHAIVAEACGSRSRLTTRTELTYA